MKRRWIFLLSIAWASLLQAQTARFEPLDVFELEYVQDPQISSDGGQVVWLRAWHDIMTDKRYRNLWLSRYGSSEAVPLTSGKHDDRLPRWSPDGKRLAWVSDRDGSAQIWLRHMDTGAEARLTNVQHAPSDLSWSPDGRRLAFTMFVPEPEKPFVSLPPRPKGAQWADPPRYIDDIPYRSDGRGYLPKGHRHIFLLPATGGTPRRLTTGPYDHSGRLSWSPDGRFLYFSANYHDDRKLDPRNSELYELEVATGRVRPLTDRHGPDTQPAVSPDGRHIAWLGYDEQYLGYQPMQLYVMPLAGGSPRVVSAGLDRSISDFAWTGDGQGFVIQYDDQGHTRLDYLSLDGQTRHLTDAVGGLSLGRPYSGGSFSLSADGRFAFTHTAPDHPADLAVGSLSAKRTRRLTYLNDDLFAYKQLGRVEELWFDAKDGRKVQGWLVYPPDYEEGKKYPLILEIHGGPFANYGWRFSAEIQLYAAAGYLVLYTNPAGSTSYGKDFGNLIHHNYPGPDYDDLMAAVDGVIARGIVDEENLFVTGGSGGGVLTAWIVGKTDRFRAAVVAKPVINWYSFVLHADMPAFFYKYWFGTWPWDDPLAYHRRSPISLAGHVRTPTMLLTGETDYRTPISETEQFFAALQLRGVESAMVRVPGASHGIARRPSHLIAKVLYILEWFERHRV